MDDFARDHEFLQWCLRLSDICPAEFLTQRPDFLVISPPKTASTWLADNLRFHPRIFIPAVKEIKYFSYYWKWLDLNWYISQFREAGNRIKGEASPSYAILPVEMIRKIRYLMPDLKLVFFMREPVARSWSHAKHTFRFHEANFATNTSALDAVPDLTWRENFTHPWPLANGDYLGQLRRWLSVFPHEQIYVDFHESVSREPRELLQRIFTFLGVSIDVDLSAFPLEEKIFSGPPGDLAPSLRQFLQRLHGGRTRELASFLREQFDLALPPEWEANLAAEDSGEKSGPMVFDRPAAVLCHDFPDRDLAGILELGESLSPEPMVVLNGYHGFRIVLHEQRFLVVRPNFKTASLRGLRIADLHCPNEQGIEAIAYSLAEAKVWAEQQSFQATQAQLAALESQMRTLQAQAAAVDPLRSNVQEIVFHHQLIHRFFTSPCRFILSTQLRQSLHRLGTYLSSLL